jgi:hypothetical protein
MTRTLTQFEIEMTSACRVFVKKAKRDGTTGMSLDCFIQNVSHLPYCYGFRDSYGCPTGSNQVRQFREIVKNVVASDKVISKFVFNS